MTDMPLTLPLPLRTVKQNGWVGPMPLRSWPWQTGHVMIEAVVPNMNTAYATAQLDRVRHTAAQTCAMLDDTLLVEAYES